MPTLKSGTLAYLDTFAGLVPVRVLSVTEEPREGPGPYFDLTFGGARTTIRAKVKVTANRGAYKVGDEIESSSIDVVPRDAVRRTKYSSYILPYHVEIDAVSV